MMLGSVSSDVGLTLLGTMGLLDDVGLIVFRCRADIIRDNGSPCHSNCIIGANYIPYDLGLHYGRFCIFCLIMLVVLTMPVRCSVTLKFIYVVLFVCLLFMCGTYVFLLST